MIDYALLKFDAIQKMPPMLINPAEKTSHQEKKLPICKYRLTNTPNFH